MASLIGSALSCEDFSAHGFNGFLVSFSRGGRDGQDDRTTGRQGGTVHSPGLAGWVGLYKAFSTSSG